MSVVTLKPNFKKVKRKGRLVNFLHIIDQLFWFTTKRKTLL